MANTNPLRFDRKMQLRTDADFRSGLDRLKNLRGTEDGSQVIRDLVREEIARVTVKRAK